MHYYPKLKGERLFLSPINENDMPIYTRWINDRSVSDNIGTTSQVFSEERESRALAQMTDSGYNFAMVLWEGEVLLGNISLMEINWVRRSAECGLFIGEREHRGRGYGTEALRLLLDYAFQVLNLHSIMLTVYEFNEIAIASYKKVGFKTIGHRREAYFLHGKYHDVVYMDILAEDFARAQGLVRSED